MNVSGPRPNTPVDPSDPQTPAANAKEEAPEAAAPKDRSTAGLGWRAKLGGQSFVSDAQQAAVNIIDTDDYKSAIDGSELPAGAARLFDQYTKEAAKSGGNADPEAFPGAPAAHKFMVDGKPVFMVFQDTTESAYRATIFDGSGKKLASGRGEGPQGEFRWD
jgi:hypothetical protein